MEKKKGLSLIELLIALAILATGFLMILGVFPVSMKSVKQGKDVLFASHLAQRQMENAIYQNFTDDNSSTSNFAAMTSIVNNVTTTTDFTYTVQNEFESPFGTAVGSASAATVKKITVTVWATDKPERYVKFETYVAREQ